LVTSFFARLRLANPAGAGRRLALTCLAIARLALARLPRRRLGLCLTRADLAISPVLTSDLRQQGV
jgi:hypothetical protein